MKTLLERFSIEDIQELGAQVVSESANKGNAAQVQAPTQEVEASRQAPVTQEVEASRQAPVTQEVEASRQAPVTQEVEASRQAPVTQEVEASRQAPVRPSLVLRVLSSLAVALLVGTIALLGSYLVLLVIYDPTQTTALIWLRLVGAAFALAAVVLIFAGVSRGELSALLQRIAHGQVVHNA
jgi:cobalamin biosynthesis Mg chelatase CobN